MAFGDGEPFVKIAAIIGFIAVVMTIIFGYLMTDSAWILAPIVGMLSVMGVLLGYFASSRY